MAQGSVCVCVCVCVCGGGGGGCDRDEQRRLLQCLLAPNYFQSAVEECVGVKNSP